MVVNRVEAYVGLFVTEQEMLEELEESDVKDAEDYTFSFLNIVYSPQCMLGAIITNPKIFGKKPFSTEVFQTFFSTD